LNACFERWDPDLHVFRFPFGELCPLPEEFGAIGGWSRTIVPVGIPWAMNFRSRFRSILFMSDAEMDDLLVGGRIHMVKFAKRYSDPLNCHISPLTRRRALFFCLVQRYSFEAVGVSVIHNCAGNEINLDKEIPG